MFGQNGTSVFGNGVEIFISLIVKMRGGWWLCGCVWLIISYHIGVACERCGLAMRGYSTVVRARECVQERKREQKLMHMHVLASMFLLFVHQVIMKCCSVTFISGCTPYPGIAPQNMLALLASGNRMAKPVFCPDSL